MGPSGDLVEWGNSNPVLFADSTRQRGFRFPFIYQCMTIGMQRETVDPLNTRERYARDVRKVRHQRLAVGQPGEIRIAHDSPSKPAGRGDSPPEESCAEEI